MVARAFALAAAVLIGTGAAAFAVDQSTREASPRSPIELCCVGTPPLPPIETSAPAEIQALIDPTQVAPVHAVKPGLDGANWSCRRPDGSQRCVSDLVAPR
jgi:hypothetical protein